MQVQGPERHHLRRQLERLDHDVGQDQDQTVGDQVGRGQGERHPQGREQEGRKVQGARRESKIKIEQNNTDQ
jgi:hypothetical protein